MAMRRRSCWHRSWAAANGGRCRRSCCSACRCTRNAAGIIPVVEALLGKGAAVGTVLAFMMSVTALSFPEMIILRKVLSLRLIAVFVGVVASGILAVGFLFNALFVLTRCVMKDVKVLGSGCKRCIATAAMIDAEAARLGVPVTIEKVTDVCRHRRLWRDVHARCRHRRQAGARRRSAADARTSTAGSPPDRSAAGARGAPFQHPYRTAT